MTKAICWKCGEFKSGSFLECEKCKAEPITDDARLISMFLSDHYHSDEGLDELQKRIRNGDEFGEIPEDLKEQLKPALDQVKVMLGDKSRQERVNEADQINYDPIKQRDKGLIGNFRKKMLIKAVIGILVLLVVVPLASIGSFYGWYFSTNIFGFIDSILPLSKVFGEIYAVPKNFIVGFILSYCLFWLGFKLGRRFITKRILLIVLTLTVLDIFTNKIGFSTVYELNLNSGYYPTFIGSLFVAFCCWTSKFKRFIPKPVLAKSFLDYAGEEYDKDFSVDKSEDQSKKPIDLKDSVTKLINLGQQKRNSGDYEGALECYRKIISIAKDPLIKISTYTFISDCLNHLKDFSGLIDAYDELIKLQPHISNLYELRGSARVQSYEGDIIKNNYEAIKDFNKALEICIKNQDDRGIFSAYELRGYSRMEVKDYKGAIEDLKKVLVKFPKDKVIRRSLAISQVGLKDYNNAIENYLILLGQAKLKEDRFDYLVNLSIVYQSLGDDEKVWEYLSEAIEINPNNNSVNNRFAEIIKSRGITKSNDSEKVNVSKEDAGNAMILFQSAVESYDQKQYDSALEDALEGLKLDPRQYTFYYVIGKVKFDQEDYKGTIDAFDQYIKLNDLELIDGYSVYLMRGCSKGNLGDIEGGIKDLTKSIELKPDINENYYIRGTMYFDSKDYQNALEDFNKFRKEDEKNEDLVQKIAYCKYYTKDYEGSVKDYIKLSEIAPERNDYNYRNLALSLMPLGRYADALVYLEKSLKLDPENESTKRNMLKAMEKMKEEIETDEDN